MLAPIDFASGRMVVELGPGTGAFTRAIAARLTASSQYLGVEVNPAFVRELTAAFPGLAFARGDAADLVAILAARDIGSVDAIVCGLPWAWLPTPVQEAVFTAMDKVLVPGGIFVTFGYLQALVLPGARVLRRLLHRHFDEIARSPIVWSNVPPAFAYICRKGR